MCGAPYVSVCGADWEIWLSITLYYHASGGFLAHHLARISMAAVYWDAQHIDEGVRFLKQHAQPHA